MIAHAILIMGMLILPLATATAGDVGPPASMIERDLRRFERDPAAPPNTAPLRRQLDHAEIDQARRNEWNRRLRRLDAAPPAAPPAPSRQPLQRPGLF